MAAWLGPDPDEHAQVDEEPFGQIRDDSDHVPGGRQVEFQPAPMPPKLRTVTLQRWQRLVGLARESVDDLHDKVYHNRGNTSEVDEYGQPQAHWLGDEASTMDPANNHDDAMFDDLDIRGHWHDGRTVRILQTHR